MWIFVISVAGALSVSALCSLLEAAVLSLTPGQIADLSKSHPRLGQIWSDFKSQIEKPIAVILILNTAAHTIGATFAGAKFAELFGDQNVIIFSLLFTYVMLQFTEILPKTLGVYHNGWLARLIALPLALMIRVMAPLLWLIHLINRPFERRGPTGESRTTLEDITALAGLARLSDLIGSHQERIIHGASRLSGLRAHEVMIPVEQVAFLSTSQSLTDAIVAAHLDPHTRFPICEDNDRDRVLGYVNFKEMIYRARTNPADHSLRGIIRPVHYARPDQPSTELLKVFVDEHVHMAIVRDRNGKTLGLITLEDLVEELVGELEDEFDRLPRMFHELTGGMWMIGGGLPVRELAERLQLRIPDAQGTTSGWLVRQFGRVPAVNDVHRVDGAEFTVRRTRRGKVFEVSVRKLEPPAAETPAASAPTGPTVGREHDRGDDMPGRG